MYVMKVLEQHLNNEYNAMVDSFKVRVRVRLNFVQTLQYDAVSLYNNPKHMFGNVRTKKPTPYHSLPLYISLTYD